MSGPRIITKQAQDGAGAVLNDVLAGKFSKRFTEKNNKPWSQENMTKFRYGEHD